MFRTKTLLGVLFVVFVASISNAADIIYVDVNGPNDPGTGSHEDPFQKIQDAIDAAIDGDIIEIQPGLYTGLGNYDLDPNGLAITIRSTDPNDPNVVANTIIDPDGAGQGFYFHSGEDANCTVSGLTITNGTGGNGGGICCYYSSPTITNCIIHNNTALFNGGGVFCQESDLTVVGCIIRGNLAQYSDGGGLQCWEGRPTIKNCVISNNQAYDSGGGVDCYNNEHVTLTNCTLVKNSAGSGGALYCWGSNLTVKNSILWSNEADDGSQVAYDASSSISISYSDVENGWPTGTGNIDCDPCFASFDVSGDSELWDLHLQSAYGRWEPNSQSWVSDSNTSLCIDAGDPNSDWSGELWPNGRRINMGAYGGTGQASMNGNPADFDIDGAVNFVDFAEFSNKWSAKESCIHDLGRNGVVDFADLRMFAENWLWQRE